MIQTIQNVDDCVPLYLPHSLYLKPLAKFNISVALPSSITGKTISNYDVMEKMRQMILPDKFSLLKVSKSTVGFIRFEGELEDRSKLRTVLSRLDGRPIRLAGFSEPVKVRASEAKDEFPTRHDWDSFFRDARNMDEMKAGERPDTIHFSNLPIKWFCPRHAETDDNAKPSESIFKRIFEKFGDVRAVDIPICDPYRPKMKAHMSGMQKFSFDQEMYFEGYVQFSEYVGFVKTMDEFRGMKLVRKEGDTKLAISISVEFDRTKHLSDSSMKKRQVVRDRLVAVERDKEEQEKRRLAEEEAKKERERIHQEELRQAEIEKQLQREQRRKEKHLQKLRQRETDEISQKIRLEEKKLLEAQRKLESIRLLDALFERMKLKHALAAGRLREEAKNTMEDLGSSNKVNKLKTHQEKEFEKMRIRLKQVKDGNLLKTFLNARSTIKVGQSRSPSINTISSDDSVLSDNPRESKKRKKKNNTGSGGILSSGLSSSSDEENDLKRSEMVQPGDIGAPVPYQAMPPTAMPYPTAYTAMYHGMEWAAMGYPYPYDPFYAQRAAGYYGAVAYREPYRATRGPRYARPRGRGGFRGRSFEYNRERGEQVEDYDSREHHRSRSNSRSYTRSRSRTRSRRRSRGRRSARSHSSRSRSRSRRRSRSRSHSRSRSRRSRSGNHTKSRSRTRSRSRRRSESKSRRMVQLSKPTSKKLASTIRNSHSMSRSRSRTRSRSRSNYKHRFRRNHSHSTQSMAKDEPLMPPGIVMEDEEEAPVVSESFKKHRIILRTDQLVKSAKDIEEEVRERLRRQQDEEDKRQEQLQGTPNNHNDGCSKEMRDRKDSEGTHERGNSHRQSSHHRSKRTRHARSRSKSSENFSSSRSSSSSGTSNSSGTNNSNADKHRSHSKTKTERSRSSRHTEKDKQKVEHSATDVKQNTQADESRSRRHERSSRSSIDSSKFISPKRKQRSESP